MTTTHFKMNRNIHNNGRLDTPSFQQILLTGGRCENLIIRRMPPPKSTAGFTKDAQKVKYVRNRDLKLSGKELKEEARVQRGMGEGVCIKCREKLQWRFQFNKYKPLKNIANCSGCHKKNVTKAYRTLCDDCGNQRNCCPGCCQDLQILYEEKKQKEEAEAAATAEGKIDQKETENPLPSSDMGTEDMDEAEDNAEPGAKRGIETEAVPTNIFTGTLSEWNSRRFDEVVSTKYSKARLTGSEDDRGIASDPVVPNPPPSEGSMIISEDISS
jgi:hypothetical protein